MGKRRCRFRFRLDLEKEWFSLGSGFGMEEGSMELITREEIQPKEGGGGVDGAKKNKKTHPQHPTYTPESASQVH